MPLLKRKTVFAAKVEASNGVAESLTNAEGGYNAYDVSIVPTIALERRERQGTFASNPHVPGARMGRCTFKTDFAWDGLSPLPAWLTTLLSGCGYVNSGGTITPRSEAPGSNVKTLTIGAFQDGYYRRIAGAVGTFKITFPTGRPIVFDWDFQGQYIDEEDETIIAPTYPTAKPIRFANATVELNNVAMRVESVVFDAANEIKLLEDASTVTGYKFGVVVDRVPKVTINPESVLAATQNRWAAWIDATSWAFELDVPGPGDSVFTLDFDNAQIINKQPADRGKIMVDQIDLVANFGATADTDVKLVFTPDT